MDRYWKTALAVACAGMLGLAACEDRGTTRAPTDTYGTPADREVEIERDRGVDVDAEIRTKPRPERETEIDVRETP
jgi:hypothetical protein